MKPIIVSMIAVAGLITAGGVMAADMPPLAKKYNCDACHTIEKKKVGPAWRDVSKAYNKVGATGSAVDPAAYKLSNRVADILAKNNSKSPEEWLLHKVSQGGAGNWGTMPMPANDPNSIKSADVKELLKFILGLEKK
jgi:cytochrome c